MKSLLLRVIAAKLSSVNIDQQSPPQVMIRNGDLQCGDRLLNFGETGDLGALPQPGFRRFRIPGAKGVLSGVALCNPRKSITIAPCTDGRRLYTVWPWPLGWGGKKSSRSHRRCCDGVRSHGVFYRKIRNLNTNGSRKVCNRRGALNKTRGLANPKP